MPPTTHERFFRVTLLSLLIASALGTGLAALAHHWQPNADTLNRWLPGLLCVAYVALSITLWRFPDKLISVVWAGFVTGLVGIATPAWVFSLAAWQPGAAPLTETLPPISAALLPFLLAMILFTPPRQLFRAALVAWAVTAGPILAWLIGHPDAMLSPRGLDMLITLGPVTLMVVLFIPFHRGMEQRMDQLHQERARAQALAERDALTGLYNRRAGETFLSNMLSGPDDADALILFDIDHFKSINDNFGHDVGDAVLKEVAARCATLLRKNDIFARWGGEEFLVLIRGSGEAGIVRVADDLRQVVCEAPIEPVSKVTASFGVARFRRGDSMQSWLKRADDALYAAKRAGRDRVVAG